MTRRGFMNRRSIVVRLTPREAVESAHHLEEVAAYDLRNPTTRRRAGRTVVAIHAALWGAGWRWNGDAETWEHPDPATVEDPFR